MKKASKKPAKQVNIQAKTITKEGVSELAETLLIQLGIGSDVSPTEIYEDDFEIVRGTIYGYLKQHGVIA